MLCLHLEFFASGAKGLSFYHPGSIPALLTFTWDGYSISRDRHVEAVDMIPVMISMVFDMICMLTALKPCSLCACKNNSQVLDNCSFICQGTSARRQ